MADMFEQEAKTADAQADEVKTTETEPTESTTVSAYEKQLRAENAQRRKENEALTARLEKYEADQQAAKDAELSQVELLQKQTKELSDQLAAAQTAVVIQGKKAKLATMASKAGLPPGASDLLNVEVFDLDDEAETIKTLSMLKPAANGGGKSNPDAKANTGEQSAADWYNNLTSNRSTIFGG